jgi:flagellar basal-body rod protein FlgC
MSELFSSLRISGSGMSVQRQKLNATSENIANAETTRTKDGGPYRRKQVVISADDKPVGFAGEFSRAQVDLVRTHSQHRYNARRFSTDELEVSEAKSQIATDPKPHFNKIYDPTHPDADPDGYVLLPDVNVVTEMVNMMTAARAFEANVTAVTATKEIISESMDI